MNTIAVNATALDTSGALTILRQFVANIPQTNHTRWIVFVSDKIEISASQSNVRLEPISKVKSFARRFMWDACGVKRWLKNNNITPSATLSLQNTNFRCGRKIPNYIYLHNAITFYQGQRRWSPFKKQERILWFYQTIYPFFINLFLNKRSELFVQLNHVKECASKRFKISPDKIHIITPQFTPPTQSNNSSIKLYPSKINLFYPATPFFYKNHSIITQALNICENKTTFAAYFTLNKTDIPNITNDINVEWLGRISYDAVVELYQTADAMVFPSYIESYGLPLLEAAFCGLPIIAADLPYAREVLQGYKGASFVKYNDAQEWANAIMLLEKNKRFESFLPIHRPSWNELFEIINTKLHKNV